MQPYFRNSSQMQKKKMEAPLTNVAQACHQVHNQTNIVDGPECQLGSETFNGDSQPTKVLLGMQDGSGNGVAENLEYLISESEGWRHTAVET
jgi:hypothetical protein